MSAIYHRRPADDETREQTVRIDSQDLMQEAVVPENVTPEDVMPEESGESSKRKRKRKSKKEPVS